ncbi:hypothetical protein LBMAG48_18150 [Phycisphaerae bacterium]|nr:hypothetical protein LBMAG48_18150 [Phycisphaerae bacterium]
MRRGVEIDVASGRSRPEDLLPALGAIVPEGIRPYNRFLSTFFDDDPRLPQVYDIFTKYGIQRFDAREPGYRDIERSPSGYFTRRYVHLFTAEELNSASHFLMWVHDADYNLYKAPPHDGSKLCIYLSPSPRSQKLMYSFPQFYVREKFRQTLEAEQFAGLRLRETIPVRESGSSEKETTWPDGRAVYLLDSPIELPPMPAMEIVADPEKPRIWWWNPGFDDKQAVYHRTEFDDVGLFDYAGTWEHSSRTENERFVIVSQRFRQFCLKHKMRFEFVPVKYVD